MKYIGVKFLNRTKTFEDNRSGSRLLSILNSLVGNNDEPVVTRGKEYTYTSDMNLRVSDIVLVQAQSSLTLAIVTSISDTAPHKPGIHFKNIDGKLELPQGILRQKKIFDILNELYRAIPSKTLENLVIEASSKIQDDRVQELVSQYKNLSLSDNIRL